MRSSLIVLAVVVLTTVLAGCSDYPNRVLFALPQPKFNPPDSLVAQRRDPTPSPTWTDGREPAWFRHAAAENSWQYIIVHHSGTPQGSAAAFDREHREVRKWENGLGYDFVIGNGRGSGDGQIETGPRWTSQICGAHCKTSDNRYNLHGIGICLVGDFNKTSPTAAQIASLRQMVAYLTAHYGIPSTHIYGHREAVALLKEGGTDCPGANMNMGMVRGWAPAGAWVARGR